MTDNERMKEVTEKRQKWYFTFCFDDHEKKDRFVVFCGTFVEARNEMIARFGTHWAFQYSEDDFKGQAEKYGLEELEK